MHWRYYILLYSRFLPSQQQEVFYRRGGTSIWRIASVDGNSDFGDWYMEFYLLRRYSTGMYCASLRNTICNMGLCGDVRQIKKRALYFTKHVFLMYNHHKLQIS